MQPLKLYKSSAGSGKTFTLVKEFLQICLPNPDRFSRVAAITFTNAAAAEMKERILDNLSALIEGKAQPMREELRKEGLTENDFANASILLEKILYQYSRFSIGTIDSFFHKILRAFSKELGLPMDFEIFLDSTDVLEEAVDEFLHESYVNPKHHKILVEFIAEKIALGSNWKIRSNLLQIAGELLKDNAFITPENTLEDIHEFIRTLKDITRGFEITMDELGRQALQAISHYGLELSDFKYGKSGPANQFNHILITRKDYDLRERFIKALEGPENWYKAKDPNELTLLELLKTHLLPLSNEIAEIHNDRYREYLTAKEILRHIYTYAIYEEINLNIEKYKEKNEVVLVSDFTKVLAKHLFKEQVSFIYAKVGSRYDHFLIDEFQDTSLLQWANLRPLVENAVAQGQACLVVGDSKQAIYRWRGGEVELIERIISDEHFPRHTCKLTLTSNFRSEAVVVQFNNSFFEKIHEHFNIRENNLLQQIFQDVQQKDARKSTGGYVRIDMLEKTKKEEYQASAGQLLLENIRQCQQDGFRLRDITILIRTKNEAEEVAKLLLRENIKFITQDSLYLDHSPAVRLLFSLLYYLSDPRNMIARTEALFIYHTYFTKKEENEKNEISITDIFLDFKQQEGYYSTLMPEEFIRKTNHLSLLPVYELTEELVRIFGLGEVANIYVERFQDVVFEYTIAKGQSIRGFLDWYKDDKYTIVLPDIQNAIQIMTIHKSKGLEFPVVMLPYANWAFKSSANRDIMWVKPKTAPFNQFSYLPVSSGSRLKDTYFADEQYREQSMTLIDNLNLLYVANTRAINRLYIISQKQESKDMESYNNIAQVITSVLSNISMNISNNEVHIFGTPTVYNPVLPVNKAQVITMENYPVFDWRSHLAGGKQDVAQQIPVYYKEKKQSLAELAAHPEVAPLVKLYELKDSPEIIFPGKGFFKPLATICSPEKTWLVVASDSNEDMISSYCGYLSGRLSTPVDTIRI
jgi:ATP-dependent exoDNAse (exonuclease V) beta subunit